MNNFADATLEQVNEALQQAQLAFEQYKKLTVTERAHFLKTVAAEIEIVATDLIAIAHQETHLEKGRLKLELERTRFQLVSYAHACEEGSWLEIRIDTKKQHFPELQPNEATSPVQPSFDLRKMLVPLGPVVVFGASNFPFAYSTAGGDTACALAAGCSVVVKAHPAHAHTSQLMAAAVHRAAEKLALPEGVFIHLHGASFEVGKALVQHPQTKAVGFTGSLSGGRALFNWAASRKQPIPVFSEMGSTNPVFLLPGQLQKNTEEIANMFAAAITQSAGQFCTNPGIIVAVENDALQAFKSQLAAALQSTEPVFMLHPGIADNFVQKRTETLQSSGVRVCATTAFPVQHGQSIPTLAETDAKTFLENEQLHQEVFGPFSMLVTCKNLDEMLQVANAFPGQLTATIHGTDAELQQCNSLVERLQHFCGRLILNGVPTGVEVALAMQHGGPYPATTDSRFTAVGADGIKRFARPVCYQNWSNKLLPDALKNENPLQLWRTVNNQLTKDAVR